MMRRKKRQRRPHGLNRVALGLASRRKNQDSDPDSEEARLLLLHLRALLAVSHFDFAGLALGVHGFVGALRAAGLTSLLTGFAVLVGSLDAGGARSGRDFTAALGFRFGLTHTAHRGFFALRAVTVELFASFAGDFFAVRAITGEGRRGAKAEESEHENGDGNELTHENSLFESAHRPLVSTG